MAGRAAIALVAAAPTGRLEAQRVLEYGLAVTATASDPALVVGGGTAALRTSTRTRLSAALGAGVSDGRAAWRGELLAHFLLNPTRRSGTGVYAAGGIAAVGGPVDEGYLVLALGLEGRPGGRDGWFAELGVGGGARVSAGWRWRRWPRE